MVVNSSLLSIIERFIKISGYTVSRGYDVGFNRVVTRIPQCGMDSSYVGGLVTWSGTTWNWSGKKNGAFEERVKSSVCDRFINCFSKSFPCWNVGLHATRGCVVHHLAIAS